MKITRIGIDLGKLAFHVHAVDRKGKVLVEKKMTRRALAGFMRDLEPCLVGLEACGGAHHWARMLRAMGHDARLMSPQFVKPYVRRQKTDGNDAEAICTAARQAHMRFVPTKTVEQQDIQALHRARQRLVGHRTAVVNQIRGLLLDRGIAFTKSIIRARQMIPDILADAENELTDLAREAIAELHDLLVDLDRRIVSFDKKLDRIFRSSEACQRIARIKGVGPKTATAVVAAIGDGSEFKNGRHLAAWIGLVPRQHSSGQRTVLLGISKRGNQYLRTLLVHGARAVVCSASSKTDPFNTWVNQLHQRRGFNRATIAVANKNARIIWAVLRSGEVYHGAR